MENSNSREYLEKITSAVIDNLRNTGPAPSVQMQDVPRKPFGGMTDEEEAELDDLDEDENKDVRMSEHRWDKQVEHSGEFEPSDDDEHARANGATRQSGNKRSFTDYGKDGEDGANETEAAAEKAADANAEDGHDVNDDTIEDIGGAEQEKEVADEPAEEKAEKEKTDGDGDVGMTDSAAEEETKIKQEEPEAEAAPAAEAEAATAEKTDAEKPAEEAAPEKEETEAAKESNKPTDEEGESKPAEAESKDKDEQPADAMDVDGDKEKDAETKETEPSS